MKTEKLKIVYEDKYLIIVNKDANLLTISDGKEREKTLYNKVSLYLKRQNKTNKVFIVHRLDKDTSGLVIFAKNPKVKKELQDNWNNVKRGYIAIVKGKTKDKDVLKSYLNETKTHLVYSSGRGKLAITEYETLTRNASYSLLKINIYTGRHHQIRVQLNDINHPIVGDKIYSDNKNKKNKRLYLHAIYIEFLHPITKKLIQISTNYPSDFEKIIKFS